MIGYISHGELNPTHSEKMPQLGNNKKKPKGLAADVIFPLEAGSLIVPNGLLRVFPAFVW